MVRLFIVLEVVVISWVGRQGFGFLFLLGVDREVSLQFINNFDVYFLRFCFGYFELNYSFRLEVFNIFKISSYNFRFIWDFLDIFCRKYFEFLEVMSLEFMGGFKYQFQVSFRNAGFREVELGIDFC